MFIKKLNSLVDMQVNSH